MTQQGDKVVRIYLAVVGVTLLVSGVFALLLHAAGTPASEPPGGGFGTDPLHEWIHLAWGLALLAPLVRRASVAAMAKVALVFGAFYVALGLTGVVWYHPLGLQLGWDENGFHLLIGPLGILAGAWALAAEARPAAADGITPPPP